jgi:hypothetical protein
MATACERTAISSQWFRLVCLTSCARAASRSTAPSARKSTRRRHNASTSMARSSGPRYPTFSSRSLGARSCCPPCSRSTSLKCTGLKSQANVAASSSCPARRTWWTRRSVSGACAPECSWAWAPPRKRSLKGKAAKKTIIIIVGVVEPGTKSSPIILRSIISD